ncbi:MAG: diacylglycerol/lipid kinase family protein [Alphaproteobacteria bacterium]
MQHRLTFFLNSAARKVSASKLAPLLEGWARSVDIDAQFMSPNLSDLPQAVEKAVAQGRLPVAVGGDGTVHQLVQALPEGTTFATLPLGSGNDFATALGWSKSLATTLEQLRTAKAVNLDYLDVSQSGAHQFSGLSVAGWGFASDVNREANASSVPGPLQYPVGVFQALAKGGTRAVRLTIDGDKVIEDRFWTVLVCNTSMAGGGMKFSPNADPQDGKMEVLALGDVSTLGLVGLLGRVYLGRHLGHPQVKLWKCQTLTLEPLEEQPGTWSPLLAEGDNYSGAAKTDFAIKKAGLSVLVPADAAFKV